MAEMADKNWKIRKESLEKVAAILNEAKFINANLGPLPESIKLRLGDSNKVLVSHNKMSAEAWCIRLMEGNLELINFWGAKVSGHQIGYESF